MSLALSVAEIMLTAIYDEWVRVSTADPATIKPIPIEMGKGNSKVIESMACAVYNPSKFLQANNNRGTRTVVDPDPLNEEPGVYEESQDDQVVL